jgi:hypothetical protein
MNYSLEMIITAAERHAVLQLAGEDRKPYFKGILVDGLIAFLKSMLTKKLASW